MQADNNENQLIEWMPSVWPSGVVFANLAKACHIFKKTFSLIVPNLFLEQTQKIVLYIA